MLLSFDVENKGIRASSITAIKVINVIGLPLTRLLIKFVRKCIVKAARGFKQEEKKK